MGYLRKHREAMIEACTKAIDACIEADDKAALTFKHQIKTALGQSPEQPQRFTAYIEAQLANGTTASPKIPLTRKIVSNVQLDLTRDTREQLDHVNYETEVAPSSPARQ
jgi:hypothetical protein